MKALSIQQPWAWLIVNGYKPVENRDWPTKLRGTIAIHASKKIDHEAIAAIRRDRHGHESARMFPSLNVDLPSEFETGGIVGEAEITDCVTESDSEWFFGDYGFVLAHAKPLPFRAVRGRLGFFDVEAPPNDAR